MLLIYYNVNTCAFYTKWVRGAYFNKKVGEVNSFDHILVQILVYSYSTFINCFDIYDYMDKSSKIKEPTRNRIIDKAICLLYKLKKE